MDDEKPIVKTTSKGQFYVFKQERVLREEQSLLMPWFVTLENDLEEMNRKWLEKRWAKQKTSLRTDYREKGQKKIAHKESRG